MSRKEWTDPAPFEVERPRLPWYTMLPRRVLYMVGPLIALWLAGRVVEQIARRLWRYPVILLGTAGLVALGWSAGWWWVLGAAVVVGVACGLWWCCWPDSWHRTGGRQIRSEYRRAWIYARCWRRTMTFSDLSKQVRSSRYYPRIRRVRSDGWRDRVLVELLRGQTPTEFARHAEGLAHAFGAMVCRVRVDRPRRVWLDFLHHDPLTAPIPPPPLAEPGTTVDLRRVVVGMRETGRPWTLRLVGRHILVVGSTDAGKSSVVWALLWYLAPAIRAGLVQVFGIDPKGGMELGRARGVFARLVYGNGPDAVELLEHVATLTRQRAAGFGADKVAEWTPGTGAPFVLLIVDELADVIAYQPDKALKARAAAALQVMTSQGRAPGVCVVGEVQDPRKSVVDFRHLFPIRVALRLDEPEQVDMVLGDGARERGAAAHEIGEDTPGVAWVKTDGRREVDRARAFHPQQSDLDELCAYVTAGRAPRPVLLRKEIAA
jgi:S-DNA-T family DNA segregation ATPase FtsK/SpoIIIE